MKCRRFVFALICCASAVPLAAQNPPPVKFPSPLEQTMIAREKSLIEAKKKDDGEYFRRTLAEGFTLVGVDGKLLEGQEALDELGDSDLVALEAYNFKVIPAGAAVVIVSYEAIVSKAPEEDQGPPPRYQHVSSTWTRERGDWKLKFEQITPVHWGDW